MSTTCLFLQICVFATCDKHMSVSMVTLQEVCEALSNVVPSSKEEFGLGVIDKGLLGGACFAMLDTALDEFFSTNWRRCHDLCKVLLDITWEHLNTGHWKDVAISWRYTYTYVSLLKAVSEYALCKDGGKHTLKEAIATCDMGLLMGAPVLDNILTKVVAQLQRLSTQVTESRSRTNHEKDCESGGIATQPSSPPLLKPEYTLEVLECPSLQYFMEHHVSAAQPVVISGAMDFWPAMHGARRWTIEYLRTVAGCRTVPIEIGSKYTDESWSQKLTTVSDFIDNYIASVESGVGYLAQHQLFDQIPELLRDISIPSYCGLGESPDVDVNAWFGPAGTVSPLHQDPKHNFLCQIIGEKYLRLYDIEHTPRLYPHSGYLLCNTSAVDVESPDAEKHPLFSSVPYVECILKPGQMLYLPPKHWHYVRSLSVSFSVSFWWQ